ncbi:MAG: peptidase [Gammaproteobacteria bacterium RIFCSPHIGHO2_12_FULL_42_10]|nr:MAG: peptidase [Gammaproteobacteria bacterium RIFCSPHIGHO2_12_FULL_42_10]
MLKLTVDIAQQHLFVVAEQKIIKSYLISTAKKGMGEIKDSEQTPRGRHIIRAKIGHDAPPNTVFIKRRATGEIFTSRMREIYPNRDWILTRIFWLSGLEAGINRLGKCDTMRRYIYIHGSPDDVLMGVSGSKGCIRMRNQDIIELFEYIPVGTMITIG